MGELTRFTLVRDVQRREPPAELGVPLLPANVSTPNVLNELAAAVNSEPVQQICQTFVEGDNFIAHEALRDHPLGRFSAWLRARNDRPTVEEIRAESPLADWLDDGGFTTNLPPDDLWLDLRTQLAMSLLVALLLPDADPKVAPALHRLLLVADLAAMLRRAPAVAVRPLAWAAPARDDGGATTDPQTAERENIRAMLHRRHVLLPEWLSRYPELTRSTSNKLMRRSRLVREPAMSDYYVVEDEWNRYEAAEVAYIENLLPRETKRRTHVRETETETTNVSETERTETTEKDTQQADSNEFSVATQTEMQLSFGLDLTVDTQGQYGPTAVQTHLAAEIDGSLETAEQTAFRVSREITTRASSKVSDRTRTSRTTRALSRVTETNYHGLDNRESSSPVVGVYRWVEQVRRLRVMRFPNRYLLEFLVPEPAAWWRWLSARGANSGVGMSKPVPFTANGSPVTSTNLELTAADIVASALPPADPLAYLRYAGRYGAVGIEPVPRAQVISTAVTRSPGVKSKDGVTGIAKASNDYTLEWNKDTTLSVPGGWEAKSWRATLLAWHDDKFAWNDGLSINIAVGAGAGVATSVGKGEGMVATLTGTVGPISSGTVPIGIMLDAPYGYYIAVEVTCEPTAAATTRWQQRTYEAIRQAYDIRQSEYREAISAAQTRAGVNITGLAPARAREVEKAELKKHVIALMSGRSPQAPTDPWKRKTADTEPTLDLELLPRDELMFLEQSLEWENMRYVHYPYFWTDQGQWAELAGVSATDPLFAAFLRAGSTRVVVPARPSFEEAVYLYTRTLIPWGGGSAPAPDEDGYLSVADEVSALTRGPLGGTQVGTSWEIRLSTDLTCLAEDELPANPSAVIPAPPT